jgi:6-pyruvoyltetrahydropterin/6-carboxytetrahydropterin synthase
MKASVFRKEHFNAAHRLFNPDWDEALNNKIFGKCALPNYHGHNYELQVKVTDEIDPQTGFVMDVKILSTMIQKEIIEKFDHKNLNLDIKEFERLNPSAENIAILIYEILRPHIKPTASLQIRLYETPQNFVEYPVELLNC